MNEIIKAPRYAAFVAVAVPALFIDHVPGNPLNLLTMRNSIIVGRCHSPDLQQRGREGVAG